VTLKGLVSNQADADLATLSARKAFSASPANWNSRRSHPKWPITASVNSIVDALPPTSPVRRRASA
jgi:hypothetical protein